MSLHPLETRRYCDVAELGQMALRKFIRIADLVIEELEDRKKERNAKKENQNDKSKK